MKIQKLKEATVESTVELKEQQHKIELLEQEIETLNNKLDEALNAKLREQKNKSYYKSKLRKGKEDNYFRSRISDLENEIKELQDEKLKLEENVDGLINSQEVQMFKNGKYTDEVRMLYQDLLRLGLSANRVSEVLKAVLEKLTNSKMDRFPRKTFAKYMLTEARGVAQFTNCR